MANTKQRFFTNQEKFRAWLAKHHKTQTELWLGYCKKHTGRPSIDWPQSVDEALCFGWIDGLRKSIDADTYMIRFTPRKNRSHWSMVNIKRMQILMGSGLAAEAGITAFAARIKANSGNASHEQKQVKLAENYSKLIQRDLDAWNFYSALSPSRRKQCNWWVMSAKQESTRQRRLDKLIECSARQELIPPLIWTPKK